MSDVLRIRLLCLAAMTVCLSTWGLSLPLAAQDAVLDEFYGTGVHHYFSGNPAQAVADLSASINGGSKDPRAFYFRALAEMRLGQQAEATADLRRGAALESSDVNQFYPVGKSLERVQGSARMMIERYRAVARAEAHQRQAQRDAARYEQRRRAEAQVLRAPAAVPGPAPVAAPPAAVARPGGAAPPPPGPPVPVDEDPFADKPAAEAPAAEEAMSADDENPAEEAPAAEPGAEKDSDDPFGDPPQKEETAEEMPADDAAPAGDADPFADEKESK